MKTLDMFSIENKVIVMVGGKGIYGSTMAQALARAGARLYIASRNVADLSAVADPLIKEGLRVTAHGVDIGDEASILALRDFVLAREGHIDALINNAVARTLTKGWQSSAEEFNASMRVNATGLFLLTRAFGDVMAQSGGGSIVHVGSIQGMVGPDPWLYENTPMNGFVPDYFLHKGGMVNFSRFAASFYGPKQVRVNVLSPGGCESEGNDHPSFRESYARHTCLGRMAKADDLVGAVIFMVSDASRYITGVNLPVDGGYTAK